MLLFALTIFLSAFLLFQVQPMIGKMILPWFGGSAAVWATCLLFFQLVLLVGYLYSHGLISRLKPRVQRAVHWGLLAACVLFLPIAPSAAWKPVSPDAPTFRILGLLLATIGLPYFVLSTTGPLIQAWFVQARPGKAPYRLFALSNLGSMLALLSYPSLVEPNLTLRHQAAVWSAGFALFILLCAATGWRSLKDWRSAAAAAPADPPPVVAGEAVAEAVTVPEAEPPAPGWRQHLLWVALAAGPSMLLLALTGHMTMDLAPIPFLWVLPLALYLLTFILAFDAVGWYRRNIFLCLFLPALGALTWLLVLSPSDRPTMWVSIAVYSACFFLVAMVCHGELARLKPDPKHLTAFFLMVSIGGAVGGVFVALIAPYAFNSVYEFHIAVMFCLGLGSLVVYLDKGLPFRRDLLGWPSILLLTAVAVAVGFLGRDMRSAVQGNLLVTRNFYGELRVRQYSNVYDWDGYRSLVHGVINHGEEYSHPARRKEVATYYCEDTGLGLVMAARSPGLFQRVGVMGLGAGTLAGYSRFGDLYRLYEINPTVPRIANDYFWYLKTAEGLTEIALGDARLTLEREPPQQFDTLVMDAFSSDAVPVHLLTKEALMLYFRHMKPDGIVAVHISNRFIDLKPVLERASVALGKSALLVETSDDREGRCYGTTWVLLANNDKLLGRLLEEGKGRRLDAAPWLRTWTDDYSNLFRLLR